MTEHDGLTVEQERELAFMAGAKWVMGREKARAEAAEARVAVLERVIRMYVAAHDVLTDTRRIAEWGAWEDQERDTMKAMRSLTAPTTEAVTEVEGS